MTVVTETALFIKIWWMWGIFAYRQISNISRSVEGNKLAEHSDVVGSNYIFIQTKHVASIYSAKTTARRDETHLSFGLW